MGAGGEKQPRHHSLSYQDVQKMPLKRCRRQSRQSETRRHTPCKQVSSTHPFPEIPVVGVCKRPSFGEAHSLDWSHSVFVGLISVAKLLSSPKSLEHLGTMITELEMLWGL